MSNSDLFGEVKFTKKDIEKQEKKVKKLEEQKTEEESGAFYNQAFEWRFEFPEVLDDEGRFTGFDVVIGNPPYVDIKALPVDIVDYLTKNFNTLNNRINVFAAFIERALFISKKNVFSLSYIIPTALATQKTYKDLRIEITDNYSVNKFVRLPNEIFGDAPGEVKVDTAIIVLSEYQVKQKTEVIAYAGYERIKEISPETAFVYGEKNQKSWAKNKEYVWNINTTEMEDNILEKCQEESVPLEKITKISLGVTPYDKYKGQTQEQIKNKVFHADHKKDETFKKLLAGNDVRRYSVTWNGEKWISYGEWLGAPREPEFFKEKRILVKQIIDWTTKRIWTALTDEELYNTQNAFNILRNSDYELEYILGILNSKLMTFYHRKKYLDEFKMRFQKILIRDCRQFPIKKIDFNKEDEKINYLRIVDLVKKVTELKKENPEADSTELEAEIDRLVYELYGLSEEETGVVEEGIPKLR